VDLRLARREQRRRTGGAIALVAGLELNITRLRPQLKAMLVVGCLTIFGVLAALVALLWLAWP
jgi:Kef-type K+ transport system membrane component KefB